MTVPSDINRVSYNGNSATVAFAFPYKFFLQADLIVLLVNLTTGASVTQNLTTNFTISGTQDATGAYPSGGTVTMLVAPPTGYSLIIYRDPVAVQNTAHIDNDPLPAASIDNPLDLLTCLVQRLQERLTRSLAQPDSDPAGLSMVLPPAVTRASRTLAFDPSGNIIAGAALGTYRGIWATNISYNQGDTVLDGANGANTGNIYYCNVSNTSGVWATDLAALDWSIFLANQAGFITSTSTTSNTIATGALTFTTQVGKEYLSGQFVTVSSTASPANYVHGQVTSYNSATGALVINALDFGGTGTFASWNISVPTPAGQTINLVGTAAGTADALTVTIASVASLFDGLLIFVRLAAANATATPTLALNALGAKTITRKGGTALAVGDLPGALAEACLKYNLANTRWELLNPYVAVVGITQTSTDNSTNLATTAFVKSVITATAPTQQSFGSGTGTYTTPAGVKWLRVRMIGGGGGGGGSGTGSGLGAGNGGNTTFGSSLWTAGGGTGSFTNASQGGAGGTNTLTSGVTFNLAGGYGQGSSYTGSGLNGGGAGGSGVFGGAGSSGGGSAPSPSNGQPNTGAGGGGGSGGGTFNGGGGGSGGYVEGLIAAPLATYAYAIGGAGTAGGAGASGQAGGSGGSGLIIVEEHYDY
jgi:hypothetical protein